MPFEKGGRADKFGNRYESRWIVRQYLRLLNEEITSITIEAIGDEEYGVDLWVKNIDGSKECHQCKARNASKEAWNVSDLNARGIFSKAKKQINSDDNVRYFLISAVAGLTFSDITLAARNSNGNSDDFYEAQIRNRGVEVNRTYRNFCRYMNLDIDTFQGHKEAYEYLKKIQIIQYADDIYTKNDLKARIRNIFAGNTEAIYSLMAEYAIENDKLGHEITSYMLYSYLEKQPGISSRQLYKDERIIPQFGNLNKEFYSSFICINNSFIHRAESDICFSHIEKENSIIIHGKAGSGKSGCVIEILKRLEEDNIIHLALKLDRRIPEHTTDRYGQSIGLPASPVLCLDAVSKHKEAVLILDQLDAIRWTNNHSITGLEVCKEIIREIIQINKDREKKLILIFVCRSFDFKNDRGIKGLFEKPENDSEDIRWKEIIIGDLEDDHVKEIVGIAYNNLSKKLKTLLKNPNNLYIWSNIEEKRRLNTYSTSSELVKHWWEQLLLNFEISNNCYDPLVELKNKIIDNIDKTGRLMIPEKLLGSFSILGKQYLMSNGLLLSDGNSIGFIHQSFYDYFAMEKMFYQIYENCSIINILGPKAKQTPMKRYQLQMLLENLLDINIDLLISVGRELIESEEVRFYMKYVFLEVLGLSESINQNLKKLIIEYLSNNYWKKHIIDAVLMSHPVFINFLIQEGYIGDLLQSEDDRETGLVLLRSVNTVLPDEISILLSSFAFISAEMDTKIYNTLCWNIEDDSDLMFEFRIKIMKHRVNMFNIFIHWEAVIKKRPDRAIVLLDLIVKGKENISKWDRHDLHQKEIEKFKKIAEMNPLHIWNIWYRQEFCAN